MSESFSFVTAEIPCERCLTVAHRILAADHPCLVGYQVPTWTNAIPTELPIIAGRFSDGKEFDAIGFFNEVVTPLLQDNLCCPLKIATISADKGGKMTTIHGKHPKPKTS